MKNSFLLYAEHEELIKELTCEQAGKLIKGIFEYVKTGEVPEFDALTKLVFIAIRQDLDRNSEKYDAFVEKQRHNGLKGGRPKKNNSEETEEEKPKNPSLFSETQKSLYDNVNVNVNENDNVLSSSHGEKEVEIEEEERKILKRYVEKNRLATKSVTAYVNKLIENGDYRKILAEAKAQRYWITPTEEDIREQLSSIKDKKSAANILAEYFMRVEKPPPEFDEIMEKYDLGTYDKVEEYVRRLSVPK